MIKASDISDAARCLREGGLVAFPTETVYGLGADATNDQAVARIFAAKARPRFNPLISHLPSAEAAFELGQFSTEARQLAERFWPGPLTLVVPRKPRCPVSLLASAGLDSLALRVPDHALAIALLQQTGRPVVAPSANRSGRISPTTAAHVKHSLGSAVDLILDGGPCSVGVESTVVQCLDDQLVLLRPGGLARETIESVIGRPLQSPPKGAALHSPGQLESHYAPNAPMRLNAESWQSGETFIGFGPAFPSAHSLSATGNLAEAAANLFRLLHEVDALNPGRIAVAPIPSHGLGEAINDRLRRAAAPRDMA